MASIEGFTPASRIELFINKENKIEQGGEKVNVEFATRRMSGRKMRDTHEAGMGHFLYTTSEDSGLLVFNHEGIEDLMRETFQA